MIKKIVKLSLFALFTGLIVYFSVFVFSMLNTDKKVIEIENIKNGEKIYLLKTSWGINDSRMAISLNKKLKAGFKHNYPNKYVSVGFGDSPIMYKMEIDTLHIYGGTFERPQNNNFTTIIKLHELSVPTRKQYCQNYNELGLTIFPKSQSYIIENFGK